MIIMDIKIDNFFAFRNFHMNMSYPKKIVDSTIDCEYLKERPNFRYKKVNILMGGNATGKTSLGKMLMLFTNYCKDELYSRFLSAINDIERPAFLAVDFVTTENILYRFQLSIFPESDPSCEEDRVHTCLLSEEIGPKDSYESCSRKFNKSKESNINIKNINTTGWHFAYPEDTVPAKLYHSIEDNPRYLLILERILKTLDPSIQEVIRVKEVENTYAIKLENRSVLIQDGKIMETDVLSSGTKAGLRISYIIASLYCDIHLLYYCDELFSYVNSDIEKVCLSIIIDMLKDQKQLFFTTHNTDILDMQLPKHSFTFLKKDVKDQNEPIKCIYASDFLKRNTDSLKHAVENDLFSVSPDLEQMYEILNL